MELEKEIGKKLKQIRIQKNYSVREVGDLIGIHYTYVSKIENGQKSSIDTLKKLCDLYGISIQSLFGKEVDTPQELKELGVGWISLAKEMKKENLTPEDVKKYVEIVKSLKNL